MKYGLRIALCAMLATLGGSAVAADWPMFRHDASRSGYTPDALPRQPVLRWLYRATHQPAPAWPTRNRLAFDRTFQPIVVNGVLCFGSSADDTIYALDATTGEVLWTFCTDAPVRFAPAAWHDRLLVVSDDGHLYCLSIGTGELLWRRRGGPRDDMLLGNDRMIARWPARGGPVVVGDVVYFGAGIWPSEGIFLYGLDPRTGDVLWVNDSSGSIEMDQPHPTARAKSGISAQGYLAAVGDSLLVPTGRAVPAVFDRITGTLQRFPLQAHQQAGGADVVAIDQCFANSGSVYAIADGQRLGTVGLQTAVTPNYLVHAVGGAVFGIDRRQMTVRQETTDRRGNKAQRRRLAAPAWEIPVPFNAQPVAVVPKDRQPPENRMSSTAWANPVLEEEAASLIVASDQVVVGGRGRVSLADSLTRALVWSADVKGTAHGLAVA
ncbi:MAG: PQQ-binding-like beta-propeller repeat protein, partial [Pirellulales bacterium]